MGGGQSAHPGLCRLVAKHWLIIGFNRKINQSGLVDRLVYIQDIQDIYKIYKTYTKYQAAARPGPEAPGPDRDLRLGAGPGRRRLAAAWYFVYILYILYIFVYILIYVGIKLIYFHIDFQYV